MMEEMIGSVLWEAVFRILILPFTTVGDRKCFEKIQEIYMMDGMALSTGKHSR
jgi:hypothetical protein